MNSKDPFRHIGGKGARISGQDLFEHPHLTPVKRALIFISVSLPFVGFAIYLFMIGLEMLAIALLLLIVCFEIFGIVVTKQLLK